MVSLTAASCLLYRSSRQYVCCRTVDEIEINGDFDARSWQKRPRMGPFVWIDTGEPTPRETYAQMVWDDEHLYLAFTYLDQDIFAPHWFAYDGGRGILIDPDGPVVHLERSVLSSLDSL